MSDLSDKDILNAIFNPLLPHGELLCEEDLPELQEKGIYHFCLKIEIKPSSIFPLPNKTAKKVTYNFTQFYQKKRRQKKC